MSFGICTLSVVPCRAEPNDRAEIVTQLLFGEHYLVLKEEKKWVKVKIAYDGYEAWICRKQFTEISALEYDELEANEFDLVGNVFGKLIHKEKGTQWLPIGATLPYLHKGTVKIRKESYSYEGEIASKKIENLKETLFLYHNAPYLWGGRTPFGIDCSGFSQMVYKLYGIKLPRDAYQQAEMGETVNFVANAQLGDLAFFDNAEGRITHVGIVLEEGKIMHASGRVRIDILDHQGIFDQDQKEYTHQLRIIKRILE